MAYTVERHNEYTDKSFCVVLFDGRPMAAMGTTGEAFDYVAQAEAHDRDVMVGRAEWKADRRDCYAFGERALARADV